MHFHTKSKWRSLAAICGTVACVMGYAAPVHGATEVKLGDGIGAAGAVVFMPVRLETDSPVVAAQLDLVYSARIFTSEGILGANSTSGLVLTSREMEPGRRRVLVYSRGSNRLPNSLEFNVPLRVSVSAVPGKATLALTNAIFSNVQGQRIAPVTLTSGQVEIQAGSAPRFTLVTLQGSDAVRLQVRGIPGTRYVMERSSDLRTWSLLSADAPFSIDGLITVTDTNRVTSPHLFYRAFAAP